MELSVSTQPRTPPPLVATETVLTPTGLPRRCSLESMEEGGVAPPNLAPRRRKPPAIPLHHQRCWTVTLVVAVMIAVVFVAAVALVAWYGGGAASGSGVQQGLTGRDSTRSSRGRKSMKYFVLCVIGGVLSGIPHVMIAPLDIVKCRMQVGDASSMVQGLKVLWAEARITAADSVVDFGFVSGLVGVFRSNRHVQTSGGGLLQLMSRLEACLLRIASSASRCVTPIHIVVARRLVFLSVLFKGWAPTLIGYCLQGAFKFGFYEYFTYRYALLLMSLTSYEFIVAHMTLIFIVASASAEIIADIALAPLETMKVRIQTSKPFTFSQVSLRELVPLIWFSEGIRGFYRCLVPLWCRQVPYTVVKFTTFEQCASGIAYMIRVYVHGSAVAPLSPAERVLVALMAGYVAGALCAIVSQPADAVVSRLSSSAGAGSSKPSIASVIRQLGGVRGLFRGLSARILMVGTLSGAQWAIYDGFKTWTGIGGSH